MKMKSESKSRKRDRDDSPDAKKKVKRRYRNDRSKKWQQHSSSSSDSEKHVDDSSDDDRGRKTKDSKRTRAKKKRRESSASSSSRSPTPDKRRKSNKKKSKHVESEEDERKSKKLKKRRKHSTSESERSTSRSPVRRRRRSPVKHKRRSKSRSKSRSPIREKKRSRSPQRRRRTSRSTSHSPSRSKKKHRNEIHEKKDRQKYRSESPAPKKKEDGPKSPEMKKKQKRVDRSNSPDDTEDDDEKVIDVKMKEEINEKLGKDEKQKSKREEEEEIKKKKKEEERLKKKQAEQEEERKAREERKAKEAEEKEKERKKERERREQKKEQEEKERLEREKQRTKEKERAREKERERAKEKERAKERERKDRQKDRQRKDAERSKKDEKNKKDEKSVNSKTKSPEHKIEINDAEEEMRKRKERIEAWRKARNKSEGKVETSIKEDEKIQKKWNLEDDEDTDEEQTAKDKTEKNTSKNVNKDDQKPKPKEIVAEVTKKEESEEDDDIDPLDAFMKKIDKEVNKNSSKEKNNAKAKTVTVVKTIVKKEVEKKVNKPEVMEQNQDAMEYSSEEETPADVTASDFTDVTKKKKELTAVDHTKIYYAPFRSNFYVEVPELTRMTADEVKLLRESRGDIQVRGKNVPKPIKTWAQAGLNSKLMNVLKKSKYEKPTPIQAQAIPVVMSGRDMIGIAKTGSGKTLAFVLPMLRHVLDQPELEEDDGPVAIIMTPTRELALQIYRETKKFCKPLQLTVACIYGGSGISEQIAELKRGAEIIVCTPGRMIDMLAANNGKVTNCRRCTYLVLDEADRMFDMGFEPQVMKILDNIRPNRQTVLFSATFPRQMEAVARKVLNKPIEIQVGGRSVVCSDIQQNAIVIEADNKFFKLLELLGVYQEQGSVLIFVEKQETADALFKDLLKKGYPCLSLHGGMDQFDRDSTIADFKNGVTKLMVSTSVAARGLDVKNLKLVVNYDCPNHYEDYVHRVGRTGRAGNKGTAFTFVTPEQRRNAGDIVKAFELAKCEVPADIQALWNEFKEDMAKEGKKVQMNSGFSGKGFKFNAEEAAQVNDAKKMRKFTLGLQDSDDEAEAAENALDKIEADLEKAFSNKPKVALAPEVVELQKIKAAEVNVDKGKLKQAGDIAAMINKKLSSGQIVDRNTAATAHILHGGSLESLKGVGLAKHFADKLNAKLNYKAIIPDAPVEAEKATAVRYEEEIDINDFPQQARWRITSKEIIEQVRELSEAGVTVRGVYIPPNKKPTEEEKRLHLYIESLSERSIQIAKAEIKRLLKEELIRAESNSYRPSQQSGRYKVL